MINTITLNSRYHDKEKTLNSLAACLNVHTALARIPGSLLDEALKISISEIDNRIRCGEHLSVVEALAGMLRVVAGTNRLLGELLFPNEPTEDNRMRGTFFLTRMASLEQYVGLTPDEIAGITMGGMLDLVYTPTIPECTETSGMGADRGWDAKKVKTINASTLSALVVAAAGHTAMKHGSYGNTTKVGSTDVPEQFGANINQFDPSTILEILKTCKFWFNDAHGMKTLHYLSHKLLVETINHIVGPMTPPIGPDTKLFKLMGVNHYVHPESVAKAYVLLHKLGVINLGGAVIIAGVRNPPSRDSGITNRAWFGKEAYLDEVSPGLTLVSLASGGEYLGTQIIDSRLVFGTSLSDCDIKVPNEINPLMRANQEALSGQEPYATYLAMNAAFALATRHLNSADFVRVLTHDFGIAGDLIKNGHVFDTLLNYITATGGKFRSWR